jgi:hypothetical protein
MTLDSSNNVRVDLQEIYNSAEKRTAYHSRIHNNDEDNQRIIICKDDYDLIHPWAMEAASMIADTCNYITDTTQTGLDAISNPHVGSTNPNDEKEIIDLMINQKQTGEYLSKEVMDSLQFNVDQLSDLTPLKYSVTQTYIRAAVIEYVLFKWYELNKITDAMAMADEEWAKWLNKLLSNSFNSLKTLNTRKSYRLF